MILQKQTVPITPDISIYFKDENIKEEIKRKGITIQSNVIIIGTVNMDDTTNSFSRKVIDRAMTFETVVGKFGDEYFNSDVALIVIFLFLVL